MVTLVRELQSPNAYRAKTGNAVSDGYAGQRGAMVEGPATDTGDAVRYSYAGQRDATRECRGIDTGNAASYGYTS